VEAKKNFRPGDLICYQPDDIAIALHGVIIKIDTGLFPFNSELEPPHFLIHWESGNVGWCKTINLHLVARA